MRANDGKNRSSQVRESSNIGDAATNPRIMGVASTISLEHGNDEIRSGGEDSERRNTFSSRGQSNEGISGKIVGRLINETEKQLAYHKSQTSELEARLEELRQLADSHQYTE